MAIDRDLVGGVHCRDRVLAILDGGDRRLEDHVFHACRVGLADGMVAVELNLDARAVVAEHDVRQLSGFFPIADEIFVHRRD